jgi:hypothetical protein
MKHLILLALLFCCTAAAGQSAMVDLSKPMSGKSRFAINADGSPMELGAKPPREQGNARQDQPLSLSGGGAAASSPTSRPIGSGAAPTGACGDSPCGARPAQSIISPSGALKTQWVNGYVRRDGTYVAPYARAPARRR